MIGHTHDLIRILLIDLKIETQGWMVTPNLDCLISRAGHNLVLLDTDIHALDDTRMELVNQVLVCSLNILGVHQTNSHFVDLILICGENELVLVI